MAATVTTKTIGANKFLHAIETAWKAYAGTEKRGLEFGKALYEYRKQFGAQGKKGAGLSQILTKLGCKRGKAQYWMDEYAESANLPAIRRSKQEKSDDDQQDHVDVYNSRQSDSQPVPVTKAPAPAGRKFREPEPDYEHTSSFLTKEESNELYASMLPLSWTVKEDGRAELDYGYTYSRGGAINTEISQIPEFLVRLADKVSATTSHPVNYIQVHRFSPEHLVRPHYDPRGMCVPMITVGQERTFRVGETDGGKSLTGKQENRNVEDHSPESEILMRHGDLLVFTGNKVCHSMYPADKDTSFNPNGYDYCISILFRYTTEAMREFGVGECNRHGSEKQYADAVNKFQKVLEQRPVVSLLPELQELLKGTKILVEVCELEFRNMTERFRLCSLTASQVRAIAGVLETKGDL